MASRQFPATRSRWYLLVGMLVLSLVLFGALGASAGTADTAESPVQNVTLYSADQSAFADAEAVHSAIENGTLERRGVVIVGETLVVEIESRQLAGDIDNHTGSPTDGFFAALEGDASVTVVQTNHGPNVKPKVVHLGPDNTTVYRRNTTTYLTVDTTALEVTSGDSRSSQSGASIERGDRFAVAVGYDGAGSVRSSPVVFEFDAGRFADSTAVLAPEIVNRSIRLAYSPDSEPLVRATFGDGTEIVEPVTEPSSSDSRQVSLDLRNVTPGTNYTLELVLGGEVVDRMEGVVREPNATLSDASVQLVERAEYVARLNVTANLSHGGTVVVLDEFGAQVGSTAVQPWTDTQLSITLRNPDPETDLQTDTLRIVAVREGDRIDQQYPGTGAKLTLDVSEIDWDRSNWTPEEPTETATPHPGGSGTPGDTDNASTETDDQNLTVGDGPSESGTEFATPVSQVGVAGVLCLLAGLGYVIRRRLGNSR